MAKGAQATATKATASKAYQLIPIIGPSEGVDLRQSATLLAPGRAQTLVNWSLEEPGALVMAPGYVHFSTNSLGALRIQGGARIYFNTAIPSAVSTQVTVVAYNQNLYTITDAGVWSATNAGGLLDNQVYFPSDRDLVAALDGSTNLRKSTNGTLWTTFGMTRPTKASSVTVVGGGGLSSAEFEINFTYKDRDLAVESNGSSSPSTITLTSTGAIEVQCANTTDPVVDAIVVYARNKTSGETVRRKVSSFAMQSTAANTHSTVTITSSAWTTALEEPTDHDAPNLLDGLSFGVVWKNRWWARDAKQTNRLHFTQIFQPQSWPTLFYIDMPFERGDAIQALQPLGDALLVFGATKIFLIIGQTSLDFEVRPTLASQDGALGPRAVAVLENGVVHAGGAGVWLFDGVSDRLLSYDIEPAWRDLLENATAAELARTACAYHLKRKELRVAVARRYPSAVPGEWILDMNRSRSGQTAWRASDRDVSGFIPWDGPEAVVGNRGRLFSWASTGGSLNEESTGYSADGANQSGEYQGPGLTLGAFRARWIDVRGEYEPHGGALTAQAVVDGVTLPSQSVTIGSGLAVYGTGKYGTATYGGAGRRQFFLDLPLNAEGRTYVQKLTYSGTEKFKLFSYHLGISPETKSRAFGE